MDRVSERNYRLSVQKNGKPNNQGPRAAEFFAGIGLVRLALENEGWRVVFANDIDPDKAEMYRHNWPKDDHLVVGDIHALKPANVPDCGLLPHPFRATTCRSPVVGRV